MDRPILFSGPMVRALLAGRKTQTRRIIDFAGIDKVVDFVRVAFDRDTGVPIYEMRDAIGQFVTRPKGKHLVDYHYSPRFAVGDRLWVREAWKAHSTFEGVAPREIPPTRVFYMADKKYSPSGSHGRPGIHMPRWASRITLTVTDVKIERLQAISKADSLAEGIVQYGRYYGVEGGDWDDACLDPREAYGALWAKINGQATWYANPWVVAVSFTVEERNFEERSQ